MKLTLMLLVQADFSIILMKFNVVHSIIIIQSYNCQPSKGHTEWLYTYKLQGVCTEYKDYIRQSAYCIYHKALFCSLE